MMSGTTADAAAQQQAPLYDGSTTESEYYDEPEDELECGGAGAGAGAGAVAPLSVKMSALTDAAPLAGDAQDADEYLADAEDDAVTKGEQVMMVKPEPAVVQEEAAVAAVTQQEEAATNSVTATATEATSVSTTGPVHKCPMQEAPATSCVEPPVLVSAVVKAEAAAALPVSFPVPSPPPPTAPAPAPAAPSPVVSVSVAAWRPPPVPVAAPAPPRFVSPFACLAVPLRPPPVVGPPPILAAVAAPPAAAVPVSAPSAMPIFRPKCLKCRSELSGESNGVPNDAHSALCHCCLRYYAADAVQREFGSRTCLNCRGRSIAVTVSTSSAPPAVAGTPTPTTPPAPKNEKTTVNPSKKCTICHELVPVTPPATEKEGVQCKCCGMLLSAKSFSASQRSKPEYSRRCRTCTASESKAFLQRSKKLKKAYVRAQANVKKPVTPQQQQWTKMERAVGKILLAERSIARRRQSNDLRGASRVEYEEQLAKEEAALMQQAAKLRQSNAPMYAEVRASLDVQDGIAPRREQDRNLTATGRPKTKVTRTKTKSAIKTVSKKRSAAATGKNGVAPPPKKKAKTATIKPPAATVCKTEATTEATAQALKQEVVGLHEESTATATAAATTAAVVARPRRKPSPAKPIEIIVIDDD
ncbi:hypothetical protein PINS_up012762 [Pythium insidiosum]|nr:hypothetical protein PINS_up012762 [Pythium insidiosum]